MSTASPYIPQQQVSSFTHSGRNIDLMSDVRSILGEHVKGAKVLSFGCSTGEECLDMISVMPEASIFGCDISPDALAKAKNACEGKATIMESRADVLAAAGPFDAIFALNVFCRYPTSAGLDDVSQLYPFSLFDAAVVQLDQLLAVNGVLTIDNPQYFFEDTSISGRYVPVKEIVSKPFNGWIEKALPSGERITDVFVQFEGKEYGRNAWNKLIRDPAVRARSMNSTYHQVWRKPEASVNRSLSRKFWKKQG